MSNPSWKAKRPAKNTHIADDKCPQCDEGRLVVIDDMLLSCNECGYDVVIPKDKGEDDAEN